MEAISTERQAAIAFLDQLTLTGLLETIAAAEEQSGINFRAWARATGDAELTAELELIAAREASHSELFRRRVKELTGAAEQSPPNGGTAQPPYSDPAVDDTKKLESVLGGAEFFEEFDARVAGGDYDPLTARLMSWYVAEERDSQDRFRRIKKRLTVTA